MGTVNSDSHLFQRMKSSFSSNMPPISCWNRAAGCRHCNFRVTASTPRNVPRVLPHLQKVNKSTSGYGTVRTTPYWNHLNGTVHFVSFAPHMKATKAAGNPRCGHLLYKGTWGYRDKKDLFHRPFFWKIQAVSRRSLYRCQISCSQLAILLVGRAEIPSIWQSRLSNRWHIYPAASLTNFEFSPNANCTDVFS